MNLRTAIKVLLIYVHMQEASRHAAEGSSLHPREVEAIDVLTRYTSGWVPGEPEENTPSGPGPWEQHDKLWRRARR